MGARILADLGANISSLKERDFSFSSYFAVGSTFLFGPIILQLKLNQIFYEFASAYVKAAAYNLGLRDVGRAYNLGLRDVGRTQSLDNLSVHNRSVSMPRNHRMREDENVVIYSFAYISRVITIMGVVLRALQGNL
jgi:hypothetical protein